MHMHAFRHTLVGTLMEAGNTLEDTSKFMGHSKVDVTMEAYYKPTTEHLHEKMNNPFTGTMQTRAIEAEDAKKELELVYEKLDSVVALYHKMHGVVTVVAQQGGTAQQVQERFSEQCPTASEVMRRVLESTSVTLSMSVAQEGPRASALPSVAEDCDDDDSSGEEDGSMPSQDAFDQEDVSMTSNDFLANDH